MARQSTATTSKKHLSAEEKAARVVTPTVEAGKRRSHVQRSTSRVKTKASINVTSAIRK